MNNEEKDKIFDRLLSMNLQIANGKEMVPDPAYINRKIGECHLYLGEVNNFFIAVSREAAVLQRALNNAQAKYDEEKEILLTTRDDIKNLPSIVEREAKANSYLRESKKDIHTYKNELFDISSLLKVIIHKHRDLVRSNNDIRVQMRMVESQIKLSGTHTDVVAKNFLEELNKGISGKDSFQDAVTESEETKIADPTVPLDVNELLTGVISAQEENSKDDLAQDEQSDEEANNLLEEEILIDDLIPGDNISDEGNNLLENSLTENAPDTESIMKEVETSILKESVIDLDIIFDPVPKTQKVPKERSEKPKEESNVLYFPGVEPPTEAVTVPEIVTVTEAAPVEKTEKVIEPVLESKILPSKSPSDALNLDEILKQFI
jgi:hypothetical protein